MVVVHLVYSTLGARLVPLVNPCREVFHEHVQFMEVNIGKEGRADAALWCAAVGSVEGPGVKVARCEHGLDELEKAVIINLVRQHREQELMIEVVEKPLDIHVYGYLHPIPVALDVRECGVTRPSWPESMRPCGKDRFIDAFQEKTDHLLDQFVVSGGYAEWAEFAIRFRDVHRLDRFGGVAALFEQYDQILHAFIGESIHRDRINAVGGCTTVGVDVGIRLKPEGWMLHEAKEAIDPLALLGDIR